MSSWRIPNTRKIPGAVSPKYQRYRYVYHPTSARDNRQQRYEHLTSRQRYDIRKHMENAEAMAKTSEFWLSRAIIDLARKYGTHFSTIVKVYVEYMDAKRPKPL